MSRRQYSYYPDDKDIYDALVSNQQKVTVKVLLRLARQRGIFLSPHDAREQLAKYISFLGFDRDQLTTLMGIISSKDRTERVTSVAFTTKRSLHDIFTVLETIRNQRAEAAGEIYQIRMASKDRLVLEVQYTEIDEALARLCQKRFREVTIEIERTPKGIRIRHQANERAAQIVNEFEQAIHADSEKKVISLSGLKTADQRNRFFVSLTSRIDGLKFHDSVKTNSTRMPPDGAPSDREEEEEKEGKEVIESIIKKIALEGTGLLLSPEYRSATEKGLHLERVAWKADEDRPGGRRVELEAGFAQDGSLRYGVRGIYRLKEKDGDVRRTKEQAQPEEQRTFYRLLETAAHAVFEEITAENPPDSAEAAARTRASSGAKRATTDGAKRGRSTSAKHAAPKKGRQPVRGRRPPASTRTSSTKAARNPRPRRGG